MLVIRTCQKEHRFLESLSDRHVFGNSRPIGTQSDACPSVTDSCFPPCPWFPSPLKSGARSSSIFETSQIRTDRGSELLIDRMATDHQNEIGNDAKEQFLMESQDKKPEKTNPPLCPSQPVCPACGGELFEIRAKLQCARCHTICETCCEGGRG